MLRKLYHSFEFAWLRGQRESLMDDEIQYHIEQETKENVRRGMSWEEARREAMRNFGGVEKVREECREAWGMELAANLYRDLAFALRGLRKNWSYTLLAILTLALGIGSNTALFSALRSLVLRPLPIREADRVMTLERTDPNTGRSTFGFSFPEMQFYRSESKAFADFAEYHMMSFTLLGRGVATNVNTAVVGANYFDFLGLKPLHGRLFLPGEDHHNAEPVMVLGHRYFLKAFKGDTSIVGATVRLNDRPHRIVGVLPPIPEYPSSTDAYMPTSSCGTRGGPRFETFLGSGLIRLLARLKPGATMADAQADYESMAARWGAQHPNVYPPIPWTPTAALLDDVIARRARPTFVLLFAITGLVLLIACASIANLSLARMLRRGREVAIRTALGASRRRLLQQFLVEGLIVSCAGGLVGLGAAVASLKLLAQFAERLSPRAYDMRLDPVVLWFCVAISILTGVFACAIPAWRSRGPLMAGTKDGGAGNTSGPARQRARRMLVAAQVAFSFAVLIAAGLLLRSFVKLLQVDPGFRAQSVIALRVQPNWARNISPPRFRAFFHDLMAEFARVPDVTEVALTGTVPLDARAVRMREVEIEGREFEPPHASVDAISPGYFRVLGIPLQSGREFGAEDVDGKPAVAIINQSMARRYWGDRDPLGKRFRIPRVFGIRPGVWITVVGVAGDVRTYALDRAPADEIYLPFDQSSVGTDILVRAEGDPDDTIRRLRGVVDHFDSEAAVVAARTMESIVTETLAAPQLATQLLGLLAALTLVITVAGIGGVAAVSAAQRRAEMGVRLALGARPGRLVAMILSQEMRMVIAGLAAGLIVALAFAWVLRDFLFGVGPRDPAAFAGAALLMLIAAMVACMIPAVRVTRCDPLETLRGE